MAKTTKTMRITLTEDFLVPTDDGNIIFEPGDEIEVEYEEDDLASVEEPLAEPEPIDAAAVIEEPVSEVPPAEDAGFDTGVVDPLSFAANPEVPADPEEDEVYIEDPLASSLV